jgi:hypothetical protein
MYRSCIPLSTEAAQGAMFFMDAKRKSLLFVLVSVLLFLCLACLEIPEMSTLTDDVSNDFTILTHGSSATEIVVSAKQTEATPKEPTDANRQESASDSVAVPIFRLSSRDLLAFHSIRRT